MSRTLRDELVIEQRSHAHHGQMYGGKRDVYELLGYDRFPRTLDFWGDYLRGLGKAVIDRKVNGTWRRAPLIQDGKSNTGEEEPASPFIQALKTLIETRKFWQICKRVDRLACLGYYAGILLGTRRLNDDENLSYPLKGSSYSSVDDLLFLTPYGEINLEVSLYEQDHLTPRFNLPVFYRLNLGTSDAMVQDKKGVSYLGTQSVHWTRLVHVAHDQLHSDTHGVPELLGIRNLLTDLLKSAAVPERLWRAGTALHLDIRDGVELSEDAEDKLRESIEKFVMGITNILGTKGVDLNPFNNDPVDPTQVFEVVKAQICAITQIPPQILFGTETHQPAGIGNSSWAQYLASRQKEVEDSILRPLIDHLIWLGILPKPIAKTYRVGTRSESGLYEWPSPYQNTAKEDVELLEKRANVALILVKAGMDLKSALLAAGFHEDQVDEWAKKLETKAIGQESTE